MSKKYGSCKYCNKPLSKTKCPTNSQEIYWVTIFSDLFSNSIYLISVLLSFFNKNIKIKEKASKKIVTCTNEDCIDYLKGCYDGKGYYT